MFPFAATVATPQPNVPSPGPLRTVTITLQAELCVRTERRPQQTETIFTGPPAALYLLAHALPKAVQRCGAGETCARLPAANADAGARTQRSATVSPSRRTTLIVVGKAVGGKGGAGCLLVRDVLSASPPDLTRAEAELPVADRPHQPDGGQEGRDERRKEEREDARVRSEHGAVQHRDEPERERGERGREHALGEGIGGERGPAHVDPERDQRGAEGERRDKESGHARSMRERGRFTPAPDGGSSPCLTRADRAEYGRADARRHARARGRARLPHLDPATSRPGADRAAAARL